VSSALSQPHAEAPPPEPSVLEIDHLTVDFPISGGLIRAVDDLSVALERSQRLAVVGESGSGKSTLALAVLGLLEPPGRVSSGSIVSAGTDLVTASERELLDMRGRRISMVFQDALGSLNPVMTIGKQICEAIRLHNDVSPSQAVDSAVALLGEVGVAAPRQRLGQYPHEFSGGMRQRVMIAMALSSNPALLIADEPTTALDVTTQASVLDLLFRLSEDRRMSVMLITHDLGIVAGFAQDVLVMYAGAPVEYGSVDEIFERPGHPYTRALIAAVPRITDTRAARLASIPGSLPPVGAPLQGCRFQPRCTLSHGRQICVDVRPSFDIADPTARVACHFASEARAAEGLAGPAAPLHAGAPGEGELLAVSALAKSYASRGSGRARRGRLQAVDGVSFAIRSRESLGLVGESGSGKSTIARLLLGLTAADAGAITFEGAPLKLRHRQLRGEHRGRIQMVFQDPGDSLNPMMTVEQIVAEPLMLLEHKRARAFGGRVSELLELVGLAPEHRERSPGQLSGGQRQRVAIARALATNPALVICDEAVSSLDVSVRAQILNLLGDLQGRLDLSLLYISHDLSVVRQVCDRVVVMYAGRFVEMAETDAIFSAPQHPYTVALLSAVPVPAPAEERARTRIRLEGDPPDLTRRQEGCIFASRCWKAAEICATEDPRLSEKRTDHLSACHFPENVSPQARSAAAP
jgi:peptide/nickel transport system ATP-binding protein